MDSMRSINLFSLNSGIPSTSQHRLRRMESGICLRLLDLLQREIDVDHPISRQDLCKRLNDMGISSNLRTLSLDIETLNDAGYEIMENQVGHEKYYERI